MPQIKRKIIFQLREVAKQNNVSYQFVKIQFDNGYNFELEHKKQFEDLNIKGSKLVEQISLVVLAHLRESVYYYVELEKMEKKLKKAKKMAKGSEIESTNIFYHASDEKFNIFDKSEIKEVGFHFFKDIEFAKAYARNNDKSYIYKVSIEHDPKNLVKLPFLKNYKPEILIGALTKNLEDRFNFDVYPLIAELGKKQGVVNVDGAYYDARVDYIWDAKKQKAVSTTGYIFWDTSKIKRLGNPEFYPKQIRLKDMEKFEQGAEIQKTTDGKKGGEFGGKSHAEGGVKAVVVDDGRPVEVEAKEVIINKKSAQDPSKRHTLDGKPMSNKEILNVINTQDGNGVPIMESGGEIPERYKNMGFSKVGEKMDSAIEGKKWMGLAKKGDEYKVVHGGYKGMEDYSQHKDEERRDNFWQRMGGRDSEKANDPFSPLYWHKKFGTWEEGGELPIRMWDSKEEGKGVYKMPNGNFVEMDDSDIETFKNGATIKYKGLLADTGELINNENLKLNYEKRGDLYYFTVYEPLDEFVEGYNRKKFSAKDDVAQMDYNQFVNYLYGEGYIDDVDRYKGGGGVESLSNDELKNLIDKKVENARYLSGNKKGAWGISTMADHKRLNEISNLREILKNRLKKEEDKQPLKIDVKPFDEWYSLIRF